MSFTLDDIRILADFYLRQWEEKIKEYEDEQRYLRKLKEYENERR
jgi:hypothetical protein